jgi:branched-chain amino acid transport system permease protein
LVALELLRDAIVLGLLVGCFYAAVSVGLSIAFGLLDVPHVAHPAFLVLGSYATYLLGARGWDPVVAGLFLMPFFFLLGIVVYRFYYETFERRGSDTGVRGLAFLFGVAFVIEVCLVVAFGAEQRSVTADYIGQGVDFGDMRLPVRLLVAFVIALALTVAISLFLAKTSIGLAIKAVAQDEMALRLMGSNPTRVKQWAFGIATAATALAGALLIVVGPVEPNLDRVYIGRTFCVVVLGGLGSMTGTLVAGLILGVAESVVLTMFGASWAPAVAFGILLVVLGIRPQGMFGR